MKKSNQSFTVTYNKNGSIETANIGTRSGVANFVRELLENAENEKVVNLSVTPHAVEQSEATKTSE